MSDPELFHVDEPEREVLSPARRRIQRQDEHLALGLHPLSAALTIHLKLHDDAAPAGDRAAPGHRCGECVYREIPAREVSGRYPKCSYGGRWERATSGPGTDVRAWWPACQNFERKPL